MRRSLLLNLAPVVAAFALPQAALAHCSTLSAPPITLPAAATSEPARRFAELLKADRFANAADMARRWQVLLADIARAGITDGAMLARGHMWLAWYLGYSDQVDRALPVAREALRLIAAHRLHGTALEAEALAAISGLETDGGNPARGRELGEAALALAEKLAGPQSSEASFAHNALGNAAYAQGRYGDAEREFGLAAQLAVQCLPAHDPLIVNQLASHAGTLYMVGRAEDALVENQRAADWALTNLPSDNPVITLALGNLGTLLHNAGRNAEAEAALAKVVELEGLYQPESWFYRAISLSNFATVVDAQGRHEEAEVLWLKALEFHQKASIRRDPITPAFPLRFAADAAQARGELALALTRREQAAAMLDAAAPDDNPERARAHLEAAATMLLLGRPAEALARAGPPMAILRARLKETDVKRMTAEIAFARILAANGQPEPAYQLARAVAGRLETRLLDTASSRGEMVRYGPAFATSFAVMTELALATGREAEAFHFLQLANLSDIVLVTSEVAARAAAADPASGAMIRAFQDLLRQRQALDRRRSFALSTGDADSVRNIAETIGRNDALIAAHGAALDKAVPSFRQLGRPAPVSLAGYQAGLRASQVLLAPLLLDDGLLAITVTRDGLAWEKVPLPRAAMLRLTRQLRSSITGSGDGEPPVFAADAARALYAALIPARLEPVVQPHRELVYYAAGPLASLPLAALIASDRHLDRVASAPESVDWLIREHTITVTAALRPRPAAAARSAAQGGFLGIGAPVPGRPASLASLASFAPATRGAVFGAKTLADLPALPGAERELRLMAAAIRGSRNRVLTGAQATERAVKAEPLADYAIIAFATHGLVSGELAGLTEPALALSPGGESADDGLLTASEVMALQLDAEWVILSACNTASGDSPGGSTFGGLAAAFMHAGARALLVSHWPVRDDFAARLTTRALRLHARGTSRAEALRRSMLDLMADPAARAAGPAAWAPFVVVEG